MTDYVLVSQAEARIEHFRRESSGSWVYRSAVSGDRVRLSGGAELDVDAAFGRLLGRRFKRLNLDISRFEEGAVGRLEAGELAEIDRMIAIVLALP